MVCNLLAIHRGYNRQGVMTVWGNLLSRSSVGQSFHVVYRQVLWAPPRQPVWRGKSGEGDTWCVTPGGIQTWFLTSNGSWEELPPSFTRHNHDYYTVLWPWLIGWEPVRWSLWKDTGKRKPWQTWPNPQFCLGVCCSLPTPVLLEF